MASSCGITPASAVGCEQAQKDCRSDCKREHFLFSEACEAFRYTDKNAEYECQTKITRLPWKEQNLASCITACNVGHAVCIKPKN